MGKKKMLVLFIAILLCFCMTAAIFANGDQEEAGAAEDGGYKIGIMPFHTGCFWFDPFTAGGAWYLRERGHEVIIENAEWNTQKMNTILRQWANDDELDGVIVAPLGGEEVMPGIRALKEAGKTVVLANNDAGYCPEADFCVRFNSPGECGKGAEYVVKLLKEKYGEGKGTVILGLGDIRNSEHLERADAIRQVFQKYPGIEIKEYVSDMDAGKAVTEVGTLLRTLPQVDAIFSVGMLEFMGHINALEREKMLYPIGDPKHIINVGMDSSPDVINPAVNAGFVDLVIDQPVLSYNAIAAYYLVKLLDAGGDTSVLPTPGTKINVGDIDISSKVPQDDLSITVPADFWAPATVIDTTKEYGHIWIQTNGSSVNKDNVNDPALWSNITGQIKNFGW